MFKILLAEDDENLRKLLKKHLVINGYEVAEAIDGKDALEKFENGHFDLLVTDVMMPNVDGNELVNCVKSRKKEFPIIMLTALDTIFDKRKSFESGADDYMTKPVDFEELLLRISALLRRYNNVNKKIISHKNTTLDYEKKAALVDNKEKELTKKEFLLLFKLMSSPDKIFSREQLLNEIWGFDSYSIERTVDVHITKIREKLNSQDVEIVSVRGLGYKAVFK